jgi:uncharacterized protein (DUF2062 family)
MPRKLIKRYLPDPHSVKENRFLKIFGTTLHDPQLWHLTRESVSRAFAVGLFCAFLPVPLQMLVAAAGAILFRANMPISVALVWITNPVTIPLFFGLAYFVGLWTFGYSTDNTEFEFSLTWFKENEILEPFLLGCFVCSATAALLGYFGIKLFWRLHIISAWKERKLKRIKKA